MGWCKGSIIAEELWADIRDDLSPQKRRYVARRIIKIFSNEDADCWDDSMQIIIDAGL